MADHGKFRMRLVNVINQSNSARVVDMLQDDGYHVITFEGRLVYDKMSFLAQAAHDLPQDPELIAIDNWDAFNDNVRHELLQLRNSKIAILWNDAQNMLEGGLADLLSVIDIFRSLAQELSSPTEVACRKSLRIFLLGSGPNFVDQV